MDTTFNLRPGQSIKEYRAEVISDLNRTETSIREHSELSSLLVEIDNRFPCCGVLTFGEHRDNVSYGRCSRKKLRDALHGDNAP
jgi:hypothetical protein